MLSVMMKIDTNIDEILYSLSLSKFRSSFHLTKKDKEYYLEKGEEKIRSHTRDFVSKKLAPANPLNDGKQTPMSGHPAFKAMHACACCCRGCLNKWYNVEKGVELNEEEQEKIVNLLMAWMKKEVEK